MTKPNFKTKADEVLWNRIYRILTDYGGFHNQTEATNHLFALHTKKK